MFEKRFNQLGYYGKMSAGLEEKIEIYEKSCEDLEKSFSFSDTLTTSEEKAKDEFVAFCSEEGIRDIISFNRDEYEAAKRVILERVSAMKEKKILVDNRVKLLSDLDDFNRHVEKGDIPRDKALEFEQTAAKRYSQGSDNYKRYLRSLATDYVQNERERMNNELLKSKEDLKKIDKGTGLGNVIMSVLRPISHPFHNAYATVHNANTNLRNKHKILNAILKFGLIIGGIAIAPIVFPANFIGLAYLAVLGLCGVRAFKHTFLDREKPKIIEKKTTNRGYLNNIKDAIFKFKMRGKGKAKTNDKVHTDSASLDAPSKEVPAETSTMDDKDKGEGTPAPEAPAIDEGTPAPEGPAIGEETPAPKRPADKKKNSKKAEPTVSTNQPKQEYSSQINSLEDALRFLGSYENRKEEVESRGEKFKMSLQEFYAFESMRDYFKIRSAEIMNDSSLNISDKKQKLSQLKRLGEYINKNIISANSVYTKTNITRLTAESRAEAYREAIDILNNDSIEDAVLRVSEIKRHYLFDKNQLMSIDAALSKRENRKNEMEGRSR